MKKNKRVEGGAKGFMSGVLVLSLSTLIVKAIGLAFKIPMLSFLGTEGMGYFNSAYEIYALLCVISTAGLPVALSILVSAARAKNSVGEIKRIYRAARSVFLLLGVGGSVFMLCFARRLANFIGNPDAYASIVAIAPALAFVCLASALRGYCQGFEDMTPTALSQLIEALSKLGFGVLFAAMAIKNGYGLAEVSAFAVFGITLGSFLSLIYLLFAKRSARYTLYDADNTREEKAQGGVVGKLISIALPITLGSAVLGLTRIIDMTLIMRRLQDIGVSVSDSNKIYGAYTTLAVPVFSLIPALITPVAMALVPQLASYIERGESEGQRTVIGNAMRLTTIFAMPASFALAAFARPVLQLLFFGQDEAIDISAPMLSVLGISVVFSCLITTTNAILQSYRRASLPIISMTAGVIVKLLVSYWLIGTESIGALGAPIGSLACNMTVTFVNLCFMKWGIASPLNIKKIFVIPAAVSTLSVGAALAVYLFVGNGTWSFLLSVITAFAVYAVFSWLMKNVTQEDIELLPFGNKIVKIKNKNKCEGDGG